MFTFYYRESDTFADKISSKLKEMVVAHKTIELKADTSLPASISKSDLPALTDGHDVWTSPEDIEQFLEDLHRDLKLSRSMQSDACHLDPDNPGKCL